MVLSRLIHMVNASIIHTAAISLTHYIIHLASSVIMLDVLPHRLTTALDVRVHDLWADPIRCTLAWSALTEERLQEGTHDLHSTYMYTPYIHNNIISNPVGLFIESRCSTRSPKPVKLHVARDGGSPPPPPPQNFLHFDTEPLGLLCTLQVVHQLIHGSTAQLVARLQNMYVLNQEFYFLYHFQTLELQIWRHS